MKKSKQEQQKKRKKSTPKESEKSGAFKNETKKNRSDKKEDKKDVENPPILEKEYEAFIKWWALPSLLRRATKERLDKYGFTPDDIPDEFQNIRTQTDFAKRFSVSVDTLTDWKKREDFWDRVKKETKEWVRGRTPNVILGLYQTAVREGNAAEVKFWMQYVEGWVEKTKTEYSGKVELEQTTEVSPELKKAVEFYEQQIKRKYQKSQHSGVDKGGQDKK